MKQLIVFVDDIQQAGSHIKNIETTAINCGVMETMRKFTFNNGTDKTAFMIINQKRNKTEKLHNRIKRGEIRRTNEYKYLGEWYNEKGNHDKSLAEKSNKINYMISKIKQYGDSHKVGHLALQVRLQIYNSTVIPTIYTNIETWSKVTNKEMEQLERMQRNILTTILELPPSTPYIGLLSELGIWPVEQLFEYKRLVLFHNILTSDDSRLIKKIILNQIENIWSGCWMEKTNELCNKYNIQISTIKNIQKDKFKQELKMKINMKQNEYLKREAKEKTKLRFCNNTQKKKYIEELGYLEAKIIMKLRLNMLELKHNYKNQNRRDEKCNLCQYEDDTTEHLFVCKAIKKTAKNIPGIDIIMKDDHGSYTTACVFPEG